MYNDKPIYNKWARQYEAIEIPIHLNTSDGGQSDDYAPKSVSKLIEDLATIVKKYRGGHVHHISGNCGTCKKADEVIETYKVIMENKNGKN